MIAAETIPNTTIQSIRFEKPNLQSFYHRIMEDNVINTEGFIISTLNLSFSFYGNDTSCVLVLKEKSKEDNFILGNIQCVAFKRLLTQKWLKINGINSQILSFQKEDNVENTLDYIFNTLDDLLIEKQFDLVNNLFDLIEIKELNIDTIVGILTITSNWKNELISRSSFYQRAYEYINDLHLTEETNQILGGLE